MDSQNWTRHGHWIGEGPEPTENLPNRARCGGPGGCDECNRDKAGRRKGFGGELLDFFESTDPSKLAAPIMRSIEPPGLPSSVELNQSINRIRSAVRAHVLQVLSNFDVRTIAYEYAANLLVGSIMGEIEGVYRAVWGSADYYMSAMHSWREAAENAPTVTLEDFGGWKVYPPSTKDGETTEYYSVPVKDVPALAAEYMTTLETSLSTENCRCLWRIHPDDVSKPVRDDEGNPTKRRMVRVDDDPTCWIHSREGRIIGFFEWLFRDQGKPEVSTSEQTIVSCGQTNSHMLHKWNRNGSEVVCRGIVFGSTRDENPDWLEPIPCANNDFHGEHEWAHPEYNKPVLCLGVGNAQG